MIKYSCKQNERGKIMAKKFLLLDLDKFEDYTKDELLHQPLSEELKKSATHDFTAEELAQYLNNEGDIENYMVYPYVVEDEVTLTQDDWYDITVNDELGVHIKRNDVGYSVDLYNVNDLSDDGFISSATALDDDFVNVDDDGWNDEV